MCQVQSWLSCYANLDRRATRLIISSSNHAMLPLSSHTLSKLNTGYRGRGSQARWSRTLTYTNRPLVLRRGLAHRSTNWQFSPPSKTGVTTRPTYY